MGRLNRNNFLNFFRTGVGMEDIGTFVKNEKWSFAIWPHGANLSFWVNAEALPRLDYRVKIVGNHGATVYHTFAGFLTRYDYAFGGPLYCMPYGSLTLPNTVPFGLVQLKIEGMFEGAVIYDFLSSPILITDLTTAKRIGNRFRFRNRYSKDGIMYAHAPAFYQDMYLPVAEINTKPERESSTFKDWNTGKMLLLNSKQEYVRILSVSAASRLFHEAMNALSMHDTIFINEQPFCGRGVYSQNQPGIDGRSSGIMEVLDMGNSTIHAL